MWQEMWHFQSINIFIVLVFVGLCPLKCIFLFFTLHSRKQLFCVLDRQLIYWDCVFLQCISRSDVSMNLLGMKQGWAVNKEVWRDLIQGKTSVYA